MHEMEIQTQRKKKKAEQSKYPARIEVSEGGYQFKFLERNEQQMMQFVGKNTCFGHGLLYIQTELLYCDLPTRGLSLDPYGTFYLIQGIPVFRNSVSGLNFMNLKKEKKKKIGTFFWIF